MEGFLMMTHYRHSDLSKVTNEIVLTQLERLVKSERKVMHLVLTHIYEVDVRKLYLSLGYDSLYRYLTQHLGYSEDAAYARMQSARLLGKVPSIHEKLENGSVNLSQLTKLNTALNLEKKSGKVVPVETAENILKQIENKTLFETQQVIAIELDQKIQTYQKVRPQKDESVRLELTLTQEQYELLKKAQDLISHSVPDKNIAEAITYLAKSYIRKVEGKPKQASSLAESFSSESTKLTETQNPKPTTRSFGKTRNFAKPQRKYTSVHIQRELMKKAEGVCMHVDPKSQRRCNSRYQLQKDHIVPLARGGTDDISNLRLLCGVHNRYEALRWGLGSF